MTKVTLTFLSASARHARLVCTLSRKRERRRFLHQHKNRGISIINNLAHHHNARHAIVGFVEKSGLEPISKQTRLWTFLVVILHQTTTLSALRIRLRQRRSIIVRHIVNPCLTSVYISVNMRILSRCIATIQSFVHLSVGLLVSDERVPSVYVSFSHMIPH